MIVKLYVEFSTWLDFTVRRCRDGDEASRIARMVSALLGWSRLMRWRLPQRSFSSQ